MTSRAWITATMIALSSAILCRAEMREWTSRNGSTVEATLVKQDSFSVFLRTKDGKDLTISPTQLSDKDRRYLTAARSIEKYAKAKYGTVIYEKDYLKVKCSDEGSLSLEGIGSDSSGAGSVWAFIPPDDLLTSLRKALDWFDQASKTGAVVDSQNLINNVRSKVGCLDGLNVTFSSTEEKRPQSIKPIRESYIDINVYNENFPYSRTMSTRLQHKDVEKLIMALEEVPFSLLAERAKQKQEKAGDVFQ